jgi:hypothetical protein
MVTLISVYSSGGVVGRCDALCYDATQPVCRCICRSKCHGVGREQAEINSRELAETWRDYAARLGGLPFDRVEVGPAVAQDSLF